VRALLREFKSGSVAFRRIAKLASDVAALQGEGLNDQTRWDELVQRVRNILPQTALSQQDQLVRMTRRKNEPWVEFLDRYLLYSATCDQVSDKTKTAELYRKLPRELRIQLGHVKASASLDDLLSALRDVRYWAHCAQDKTVLFDPMEVDAHSQRDRDPLAPPVPPDDWAVDFGFRQGEGRSRRPVLQGDTINFKNIDGPRSLMTAWKKLVSTSPSLRREASDFISRSRPNRGLRELAVDSYEDFDGVQDTLGGLVDSSPDEDFGHLHTDFVDGEADFWDDSFYDCAPPPLLSIVSLRWSFPRCLFWRILRQTFSMIATPPPRPPAAKLLPSQPFAAPSRRSPST
jgi:hypothetical protein